MDQNERALLLQIIGRQQVEVTIMAGKLAEKTTDVEMLQAQVKTLMEHIAQTAPKPIEG